MADLENNWHASWIYYQDVYNHNIKKKIYILKNPKIRLINNKMEESWIKINLKLDRFGSMITIIITDDLKDLKL